MDIQVFIRLRKIFNLGIKTTIMLEKILYKTFIFQIIDHNYILIQVSMHFLSYLNLFDELLIV